MATEVATQTFGIVTLVLAVGLGAVFEATYKLAWPPAPEESEKRAKLKEVFVAGASLTVLGSGYALATGGIPKNTLYALATIEAGKGFLAAVEVARMEAPKWSKWVRLNYEKTLPKRQALTTAVFGLTGLLEFLGFGPVAFVPAVFVLAYALSRRFDLF